MQLRQQLRQQSQQQLEHFHTVRLILGDQLNAQHTWYQQVDPKVLYLIAELHQENTYVGSPQKTENKAR